MDREELERQMVLEEPHNTEYWKSMNPRLRMKLILSYGIDWALCILLAGSFEALNFIPGNQREFSLTDTSIQHTFAEHERVPVPLLFAIAFGGPIVFMPIANMLTVKSWWDLHNSYLGLTLGLSLTASLTEIVKVTVGRPRPDLIDRCQPLPGSVDHPIFGLSNVSICTQTDKHILKDGFKSFFSGHSSFSFAGLGFLAFYLAGKLHLFDRRGHSHKAWLAFAPLVGAALIAISRTMDNRHHWHDVTVGSIVGLTLSFFSYRQFYPKLSDRNSHLPHAPRSFDLPRPPIPIPHLPIHSRSGSASMAAGGGAGMGTGIGRYSDLDLEEGRSMEMQRTSPSGGERGNLLHP
jgi:diacylglycerol diphosphate phosphatase/phosphatidate phosphatase